MRRVRAVGRARGFTMVELLVTVGVISMVAVASAPMYSDYISNSRLREGGNTLLAETLYAQAEAAKRNTSIQVKVIGGTNQIQVLDLGNNAAVLRQRTLPEGVTVAGGADAKVTFGSTSRPVPFGAAVNINLQLAGVSCSDQYRCPGLRVDGGGGIQLCKNTLSC